MTDDQLLEQFFQSARETTIEDNGFTQSVMSQLPKEKTMVLSRLWTVFCFSVFAVLFVVLRGWDTIANALIQLLNNLPTRQNILMLTLATGIIGLLAVTEIISRERCQAL